MFKNCTRCVGVSLVLVLSALGFVAKSFATCELDCMYFRTAIGNITPDTLPYGTYCMDFNDSDRGGEVYPGDPSDLVNGASKADECNIYAVEDCFVAECTNYNPVVAGLPPGNTPIDTDTVIRYNCESGGM